MTPARAVNTSSTAFARTCWRQVRPFTVFVLISPLGILNNHQFEKISLFSDGCKTHNKNYQTQCFLALLKKELNVSNFSHHVLAPYEGHNQCDSSIAHAKIAIRKDISQGAVMNEVAGIASSYERLKSNFHLIEVKSQQFQAPRQLTNLDPFVAASFDFEYGEKKERELPPCSHDCHDKINCGHKCCKPRTADSFEIHATDKEGVKKAYLVIVEDQEVVEIPGDGFAWFENSATWKARNEPQKEKRESKRTEKSKNNADDSSDKSAKARTRSNSHDNSQANQNRKKAKTRKDDDDEDYVDK